MKKCEVCGIYSFDERDICPGCGENFGSDHAALLDQVGLTAEGIGSRRILKTWGRLTMRHVSLLLGPLVLTLLTIISSLILGALFSSESAIKLWATLINAEALIPYSTASSRIFSNGSTVVLLVLTAFFSLTAFTFWSAALMKASSKEGVSLRGVFDQTIKNLRQSIPAAILLLVVVAVLWLTFFFALFQPLRGMVYRYPDFIHTAPLLWLFIVEMPALYVLLRCSTIVMLAVDERAGARASLGSSWAAASSRIGTVLILALITFLPTFILAVWDAVFQAPSILTGKDTVWFLSATALSLFLTFTFAALPAIYIVMIVLRKKLL